MPTPPAATDETKAEIIAALLTGQSVSSVARAHHLSRQTIMKYRDAFGVRTTPVVQQVQADIGQLVLEHVRTSLLALAAQATVAADPTWIRGQSASQLADLFGVMSDKTHRILAALQSVATADEDADDGEPGPVAP